MGAADDQYRQKTLTRSPNTSFLHDSGSKVPPEEEQGPEFKHQYCQNKHVISNQTQPPTSWKVLSKPLNLSGT
jgi:hypothetical protein